MSHNPSLPRLIACIAIPALMTLGAACTDQTPQLSTAATDDDPAVVIPPGAVPVNARQVLDQPHSGIPDARRSVIRNAADWEAFWQEAMGILLPVPPAPAVDFAREMIIAATLGQRPTGGYDISIDEVYTAEGRLFVVLKETSPSPGTIVTQAITAPVAAVAVARTDAPVVFVP